MGGGAAAFLGGGGAAALGGGAGAALGGGGAAFLAGGGGAAALGAGAAGAPPPNRPPNMPPPAAINTQMLRQAQMPDGAPRTELFSYTLLADTQHGELRATQAAPERMLSKI